MKSAAFTIITGATSGIGKACADALAKEGKNLILVGRRKERLETLQKTYQENHGVEVQIFAMDVSDPGQVDSFFKSIESLKIEALINNAGLALGKEKLQDTPWEDIETMIKTNITGFIQMAKGVIPFLEKTKGHIVNLGSIAGNEAYEGGTVYCATKATVKMISRGLRIDVIGTGIRVTNIAPGNVETEFAQVRFHGDTQKAREVYQGFVPLSAQDVAECIQFALSRPKHVNIDYMLVMPTAQATVKRIERT